MPTKSEQDPEYYPSIADEKTRDGMVEYVYTPSMGHGKTERVYGILGKDRRETIELVKRSISMLAGVENGRFGFKIDNGRGESTGVTEEAWSIISKNPPPTWTITIQEPPGEDEHRVKSKSWEINSWKGQLVSLTILSIVTMIAYWAGLPDGTFWGHAKVGGMNAISQMIVHAIIGGISAM